MDFMEYLRGCSTNSKFYRIGRNYPPLPMLSEKMIHSIFSQPSPRGAPSLSRRVFLRPQQRRAPPTGGKRRWRSDPNNTHDVVSGEVLAEPVAVEVDTLERQEREQRVQLESAGEGHVVEVELTDATVVRARDAGPRARRAEAAVELASHQPTSTPFESTTTNVRLKASSTAASSAASEAAARAQQVAPPCKRRPWMVLLAVDFVEGE
jgi:hypothetical protein